ncbi:hypothetical protein VE01_09449 [Pseudogymnoascus verrucosus]|uniref:RING-type domain-containing protein n=1 Tax=Pseudogymnoascus verrucosus TaxID=342668 RepID=A0A1B8G9P7_9PEZI|nr:uncharacterized protein VE01_09449 [Pseudogymnoascus verrucosus]OBT92541.1 hypothetical protein VE01_09449 [Pseudogymnoascus verrucosus]
METEKKYAQDGCTPGTAIVISDHDDPVVRREQIRTHDLDLDKNRDIAMLLLNLRGHVDKLEDGQIQRQNYELEIAGYKSRITALEEAERERIKASMCRICYGTPNSHFLSCGHAFCQECILRWVLIVEEFAISIWKPFKMEMLAKSDVKFPSAFRQVSIKTGKADSFAIFCL